MGSHQCGKLTGGLPCARADEMHEMVLWRAVELASGLVKNKKCGGKEPWMLTASSIEDAPFSVKFTQSVQHC